MKKIILLSSLIIYTANSFSQKKFDSLSLVSGINESFRVLDSLNRINVGDTIAQNGVYYINFLAKATGIAPSSDGTFMGYLYCTKSDLKKWHNWYDKKN